MASNSVFIDSNGWIKVLNEDEPGHHGACELWYGLFRTRRRIFLTDWIIAETGNALARTRQRRVFVEAVRRLATSPRVRILPIQAALFRRALELYEARPDKTWGLVDCASSVVMEQEGIAEAFTTDRHFEQAGFNCLLPLAPV